MEPLRHLLRDQLARGLRRLPDEDRVAAALPLVCGSSLAAHCRVLRVAEGGQLHLEVDAVEWMRPLLPMREAVLRDLAQIAGARLTEVHFHLAAPALGEATTHVSVPTHPLSGTHTARASIAAPRRFR